MTQDDFGKLAPGDIIRSKFSRESYSVLDVRDGQALCIRTVSASVPREWDLIYKAELRYVEGQR